MILMSHMSRLWLIVAIGISVGSPAGCGRVSERWEAEPRLALRIAVESDVHGFDPHLENEVGTLSVLDNIFEPLVRPDQQMGVQPCLATNWETPNELTWRAHLREGVRFHDGVELTSEDVKYSYDRILQSPETTYRALASSMVGIDVIDRYTIDLKLRDAYNVVVDLGGVPILPSAYIRNHGLAGLGRHPVGTGPYRFSGWDRGREIRLTAFAHYWRRRAAYEQVVFSVIPRPEYRLRALEHGIVDIAYRIPSTPAPENGYRLHVQPSPTVYYMAFDVSHDPSPYVDARRNPFRDAGVRRAFQLAVNVETLVDRVLAGRAVPASQLVAPGVFGYNPAITPPEPDRDRARGLLREAGFPKGFTATFDLIDSRAAVGEFLKSELEAIGVRLRLNLLSRDAFYKKIYADHDSSLYLVGWSCSSGDANSLFQYGLHTLDVSRRLGLQNVTGYSNSRLDQMIEVTSRTADAVERLEMLQQTMDLAMSDLPWLPLWVGQSVYGIRSSVLYTPRLDDHIHAFDARPRGY